MIFLNPLSYSESFLGRRGIPKNGQIVVVWDHLAIRVVISLGSVQTLKY